MTTRLRKIRKQRGSRTMGWGTSGQHRDGGMRGGHGRSGRFKHKWTHTVKYSFEEIGRHGFKCPTSSESNIINLKQLEELFYKLKVSKALTKVEEKYLIDLNSLGYNKLLGTGKVNTPIMVSVSGYSESARKKLEEAGGGIISTSKET